MKSILYFLPLLLLPLSAMTQQQPDEMEPQLPQQLSSKDLLIKCSSSLLTNRGRQNRLYCYGFVSGIEEAARLLNQQGKADIPVCAPSGITARRLASEFVRYTNSHKQNLDKPAAEGTLQSLSEAFPCNKAP